ncbi:MAG: 30S ribosomal protein S9 [Myxococcales bacterium]
MNTQNRFYGTGRRRTATARVYLSHGGTGTVLVNKRPIGEYLRRATLEMVVNQAFELTETEGQFDVKVTVRGGGLSGQAGAIKHGISRALCRFNPELRGTLKRAGFLTRDARIKERKKPGRAAARARFQFSKR